MAAEPAKKTLAVDDEVNMRVTVKKYLEFLKFEAHAACNDPRRVWRERAVLTEPSSIPAFQAGPSRWVCLGSKPLLCYADLN